MNDEFEKIRITAEDLNTVETPKTWPSAPAPPVARVPRVVSAGGAPRQWGTISGMAPGLAGAAAPVHVGGSGGVQAGSVFLKSWVYLGLAGLLGAFLAWAVCEPAFIESRGPRGWGNIFLFPLLITGMCVAYATAESLVERSFQKLPARTALALVLGLILGFIFQILAGSLYSVGMRLIADSAEALRAENPALWLVRGVAWMVFGITGGLVYGIIGRSGKKCLFGILGGMLGAGLGGGLFDPISLLTGGGGASRCVGMMLVGAITGMAMGLVESALKDRWLYVSGGPLAGKQFILYKPVTLLGSQQSNDIYLFKDASIDPVHATIEVRGSQTFLLARGPTFAGGQPVSQRLLRSGDVLQIGRYTFQYQEKQTRS